MLNLTTELDLEFTALELHELEVREPIADFDAEVAAAVGCKATDVGTMLRRGEAALKKEVGRHASE